MSIGTRLKEERQRLGKTQTDFAALASASKGALINWEKDVSSPPATALVAFGEAGADVLYVLTGKRMTVPFNERGKEWGPQDMLDKLEEALRDPDGTATKQGTTRDEALEGIRSALTSIATSGEPDVTDPTRERADDLLRTHFDDEAAAKRRSLRYASLMTRRQHASRNLDDALDAWGLKLPRDLHHQLLMLVLDYQIDLGDLIPLLGELSKPLSKLKELEETRELR